ncbi:MAG: ferrous iron transport protein B, partial [Deltaproteobacteria bacterium]|nr:ferrous iron transport protein B [Deltaproteobacteria bacterium]
PGDGSPPAANTGELSAALIGQPNVGKSTIFNMLTGLNQHVGNWPGKTVEKKEGTHVSDDVEMRIVDLPGTYSLTAFSEEERIARDFIIETHPDVIVLLVNAAAPERSLYLLSELLLLTPPVVVAVNMIDVAEAQGIRIVVQALQKSLGIPVVAMVASKNVGIRDLVAQMIALSRGEVDYCPHRPEVAPDHRDVFFRIMELIQAYVHPPFTLPWAVTKLMEGDPENARIIEGLVPGSIWREIRTLLIQHEDSLHAVVGGRYDWIEEITRAAVSRFKRGQVLTTDRIDHILTRPVFGLPILLGIFGLVFLITYQFGFPLQKGLEWLISHFARWLQPSIGFAPAWIRGLLIDGIIGGVGSILTFLPILLIFFGVMAMLEDVGYMARAAFVMDRFMHLIGLHGKSFIPLCLGFGCNVPAILGARIVESRKERLLTVFLSPFIPCTARLAVLTFVSAAMFAKAATLVSWSLLTANILILGGVGILINRFFMRGEPMPFIMELPLYHKPDLRTIWRVVWSRTIAFVKRAGTVILVVSILIWTLSYFPDGSVESSFLAQIGRFFEPVGRPIGLDWKMITALLTSIMAKENAIATLAVLYGVGEQGLVSVLPKVVSPASALAFLVVLMLFVPCVAAVTAMKREMEDWKWFTASLILMLTVSLFGGMITYHVALWAGL